MKNRVLFFAISLSFFASSCVTTHYRTPDVAHEGKMKVSCSDPERLTDQFLAVSCTFENTSQDWMDLESSGVNLANEKRIEPLTADQTRSFLKSYEFQTKQNETNTNLLLSSLVVVGAVATLSGNSSVSGVGAGVAGGALATAVGRDVRKTIHDAQYPEYGEDHILGAKVNLPPNLYVRRSAIFQVKNGEEAINEIEICFKAPKVECLVVKSSTSYNRSRRG